MDESRDVRMNPFEYVLILRRRIRWLLIPAGSCLLIGTLVTFLLPAKYRSAATIAITGGSLSSDLAHPIDREERVRAFSQHLFEAKLLSEVAGAEHLTASRPTPNDIAALRTRILVGLPDPVPGTDPTQVADMYVIWYSDSTPERARRVAQRLADTFVADTSKVRQERLEDSSQFLESQMREVRARMDRIDSQLAAAKSKNMGRLPEQTAANVQMVQSLGQARESANTQLRGEQDRLNEVNRTIAILEQQETTDASGALVPTTAQQRVADLQRKLADARLRYTDRNPEVTNLQDELADARKQAAAERAMPLADRQAALAGNPAYRQALDERRDTQLRIRDIRRQIEQYDAQMRAYEGRLQGAPLIESEIQRLEQDRSLQQKHYDDLSAKYENARLAESTELERGSEHFRVLYPATTPVSPYEPNRQRLLLLTVGVSLFLGVGSAVAREYLDPSVHDARALQQAFDVPVLGDIPHIRRAA